MNLVEIRFVLISLDLVELIGLRTVFMAFCQVLRTWWLFGEGSGILVFFVGVKNMVLV